MVDYVQPEFARAGLIGDISFRSDELEQMISAYALNASKTYTDDVYNHTKNTVIFLEEVTANLVSFAKKEFPDHKFSHAPAISKDDTDDPTAN